MIRFSIVLLSVVVGVSFGYICSGFGKAYGGGALAHYDSSGSYAVFDFNSLAVGSAKLYATFYIRFGVYTLV